jgi:hypothetical protein
MNALSRMPEPHTDIAIPNKETVVDGWNPNWIGTNAMPRSSSFSFEDIRTMRDRRKNASRHQWVLGYRAGGIIL